jgi:DNA-binding response OmpR family regulator
VGADTGPGLLNVIVMFMGKDPRQPNGRPLGDRHPSRRPATPAPPTRRKMAVMSEARLLLVDDDPAHLGALADRLTADGFEVARAGGGAEALELLTESWPDLVILDLMMPGMDGQTLARRIKSRADIPILVLSAVVAADSKADLIAQFAEDYVTKPYDYNELVARVRRVLRRLQDQIPVEELALGDLILVPRKREAIIRGRHVSLSPTESRFLATLAASMPKAVSTEQLLRKVWVDSDAADPAYVWVTVRRLRQKLEIDADNPKHLLTDAAGGYRLAAWELRRELPGHGK